MKECPSCHSQVDEKTTRCLKCGHDFGPALEALIRLEPQLGGSVEQLVELANVLPSQLPIVVIKNVVKGSFNDIGDKVYGERGSRLLMSAEIQAGTERALANKESEKRAHGDTLRTEHISELFRESDLQWRELIESKLERFLDQVDNQVEKVLAAPEVVDRRLAIREVTDMVQAFRAVAQQLRSAQRALEQVLAAREVVERATREVAERERAVREATARGRWPSNTQAAKTFRNIKAAIAGGTANKGTSSDAGSTGGGK